MAAPTGHDIDESRLVPAWVEDDEGLPVERRGLTLEELAEALVRGATLVHATVPSLRALIERVCSIPDERVSALQRVGIESKALVHLSEGWEQFGDRTAGNGVVLDVRGCVVCDSTFSDLDIACTLDAASKFGAGARFDRASFGGDAWFNDASFGGDARFAGARFGGDAWFNGARFGGDARFAGARFGGDAWFNGARFGGDAWFNDARFGGVAWFVGARFGGDARFNDASFGGAALFGGARFGGDAWFAGASFGGDVWFDDASFGGDARFNDASFGGAALFDRASFGGDARFDGASFGEAALFDRASFGGDARFDGASFGGVLAGDLRVADVRSASITESRSNLRRWLGRRIRDVSWTSVSGVGRLAILTRVSLLALVVVPVLAGSWPAVRVAINGYNRAVDDATGRFNEASERVTAAADALPESVPARDELRGAIDAFTAWAEDWRRRFGQMTLDDASLPWSIALVFFAAVCVTLGQFVYQVMCPRRVQERDEEAFVDWMQERYREGSAERNDGLRRACDHLATIARARGDRRANLVKHHGEVVWVPPKERLDWFEGPEFDERQDDSDGDEKRPRVRPQHYVTGAERARIVLEEGARAEYWLEARKNSWGAAVSLVLYAAGVGLLLWILWIQVVSVGAAAGWW